MNLDEYLRIVGGYAERLAAAERQAKKDNMAVASAMDLTWHESELWVPQWLEQRPEPKRPTNRWNPADRNRFIAWTAWRLQQDGHVPLSRPQSWMLMESATIARSVGARQILHTVEPMKPLFWLRKNQYENRLPDVWAIAVNLAGGDPKAVTSAHTREALAQWKRDLFGHRRDGTIRKTSGAIAQAAAAAGKANQLRARAMEEVREMYRLAALDEKARDEFEGFLSDLDGFLDEHTVAAQVGAA